MALVLLTLAVGLAVLEAAVPGLGVAGGAATVLVVGAAAVVWQTGVPAFPLSAVAMATAVWTAMLGGSRPPMWAQAVAAGLYAVGGVTFGVVADDPPSVVVAVAGAATLAVAFPPLHRWTRRLVEQQPRTGMEALVGRTAVVEGVGDSSATRTLAGPVTSATRPLVGPDRLVVRLDGALWSIAPATGAPLAAGSTVVVRGWRGVVLAVEPVTPGAGVPSASS